MQVPPEPLHRSCTETAQKPKPARKRHLLHRISAEEDSFVGQRKTGGWAPPVLLVAGLVGRSKKVERAGKVAAAGGGKVAENVCGPADAHSAARNDKEAAPHAEPFADSGTTGPADGEVGDNAPAGHAGGEVGPVSDF